MTGIELEMREKRSKKQNLIVKILVVFLNMYIETLLNQKQELKTPN